MRGKARVYSWMNAKDAKKARKSFWKYRDSTPGRVKRYEAQAGDTGQNDCT